MESVLKEKYCFIWRRDKYARAFESKLITKQHSDFWVVSVAFVQPTKYASESKRQVMLYYDTRFSSARTIFTQNTVVLENHRHSS